MAHRPGTGGDERIEDRPGGLARNGQFPPALAHIGEPRCCAGHSDYGYVSHGAEGEAGPVVRRQSGENLARRLAHHADDCIVFRDIPDLDSLAAQGAAQQRKIAPACGRSGHDPEPIGGKARNGHIRFDAASHIEHQTVDAPPNLHVDPGGREAVEEPQRIGA